MQASSRSLAQALRRRHALRACCLSLAVLAGCADERVGTHVDAPATVSVESIAASVDAGAFSQADAAITEALADATLPEEARRALAFERDRMRRIRMDFGIDRTGALVRARRVAPDLTDAQFDAFDAQGLIESMRIDGEVRYFNRAPYNLFRLSADARALRPDPDAPFADGPYENLHPHHVEVLSQSQASGERFVAARRIRISQS
ncbi:MAG TPA: transglutaminase domain-containing protein, partial [Chiayiivirga sp.]|nr:transglutaminase domain-containing protein [Chiayiivirga sp.]